jgi:hypothetical protein
MPKSQNGLPHRSLENDAMRTTIRARVARPAALVAALAAIAGAVACSDITPPTGPELIAPSPDASFSGYALASGKADSTTTKKQ